MSTRFQLWEKDAALAYALLRITLGLNICMHGVVRWASGLGKFSASLMTMFQNSPMPSWTIASFGYALPILETVIGGAILVGFETRRALTTGMILMLLLMFGSSLRQDWQIVGLQLIYSVTYAILLATSRIDCYGVDRMVRGRSEGN